MQVDKDNKKENDERKQKICVAFAARKYKH